MSKMTFGDWLKNERALRRMPQSAVERASGIQHSHYSKLERGKIPRPEEETRQRLHQVFGTSDSDLEDVGILRKRVIRSPDGKRKVVVYEYNDPAAESEGASCREASPVYDASGVPEVITAMLARIDWSRPNTTGQVKTVLSAFVRSDEAWRSSGADGGQQSPPEDIPARFGSDRDGLS